MQSGMQVFANPRGLYFELVTVLCAHNVRLVDPETDHHTWFVGYAWTIALCVGCAAHVGWRYRRSEGATTAGGPAQFFGFSRAALVLLGDFD
jgi:cereblon